MFLTTTPTRAQTASDLNEGLRVTKTAVANEYEFSWWGKSGHSYFLQISTDLVNWTYAPDFIEGGNASAMAWGMNTNAPRHFLRLRFTNQTAANLETADFDNDGLENILEITPSNQGGSATDPLDADCDDDTWLDGIEHDSGSLPHDAASTPMTVALARFTSLQSVIAAYESLRQSGSGTYAQLSSMHSAILAQWDALQDLLDDIDAVAPGVPTAPMRPGAPAGPSGAPPLPSTAPPEPPQPHSTGDLVGRWITSSYSELREGFIYGDWSWQETLDENGLPNGGAWTPVAGTANYSWDDPVRIDGPWAQSTGASGENLTLEQAANRDQTQEPGDFQPSEAFTSVNGYYTDEAQIPPSHSLLPEPNTPGQSPGEAQTTYNSPLYAGLTYNSQISELRLRRSAEGSRQTLIVRGFLVEMTDSDTQSGQSVRSYRSATLDIQPDAEESGGSLVLNGKTTTANTGHSETAQGYEIKPHGSMYNTDGTGKLGDLVPSVVPNSKVKHFVTPKDTPDDEIAEEWVVLVAEGLTAADFQEGPNGEPKKFDWVCNAGQQGDAANEWKIKRDQPKHAIIKISDRAGGEVEMQVWVVWVELTGKTSGTPKLIPTGLGIVEGRIGGNAYQTHPGIEWSGIIEPDKVITNAERPALEKQKRVSPPGDDTGVASDNNHDASNAGFSGWDMSRKLARRVFLGPNLDAGDASNGFPPIDYPSERLEGNDDVSIPQPGGQDLPGCADEDNYPYQRGGSIGATGELLSVDRPKWIHLDALSANSAAAGFDGDRGHRKLWFREFARVQIGSKWYVTSGSGEGLWRTAAFHKRMNGEWNKEANAVLELNNTEKP